MQKCFISRRKLDICQKLSDHRIAALREFIHQHLLKAKQKKEKKKDNILINYRLVKCFPLECLSPKKLSGF